MQITTGVRIVLWTFAVLISTGLGYIVYKKVKKIINYFKERNEER